MAVQVAVLGPMEVDIDGWALQLAAPKERAILALLAVRTGTSVPRSELIAALWGDNDPPSAAKAVQMYVSRLRRLLPPGVVETVPNGYRCGLEPEQVDALRFARLVGDASGVVNSDPQRAAYLLTDALGLWRGPALVDLAEGPVRAVEIPRLDEMRRSAQEQLAEAQLRLGAHETMVGDLEAAVAAEPLRERRWAQLITALYRCGRQADALRAYQRLRVLLREELGLEPSTELQILEAQLLRHDPALASPLRQADPPDQVPAMWRFVPTPIARLIGRQADVADIVDLIVDNRLVTLTGVGGVGKTRLAVACADRVASKFPDGVGWVDLSVVDDEGDVPQAVAEAVGVPGQPGVSIATSIPIALQGRRILVLLDNCEHLRAAAADVATSILAGAGTVSILATSREPLGVTGERLRPVTPLPVGWTDAPAVELLVDRMGIQPTDEEAQALLEIAGRLDGLPLALELAGARCRSLGPHVVASRLAETFDLLTDRRNPVPRHQTLDATLDWSFGLLSEAEQSLFARLSVFMAGFTLAGAEAVAGTTEGSLGTTAETVASLVDKSLLTREAGRFKMLETTRAYAARKLTDSGTTEAVHRAHDTYMLTRLEVTCAGLRGRDEARWMVELEQEWPDTRAVVRRAFTRDDRDVVARVVAHLGMEMLSRQEALAWALEAADRWADRDGPHQADLLAGAAIAAYTLGRPEAVALAETAMSTPGRERSPWMLPEIATMGAYYFAGQYDKAMAVSDEALAAAERGTDIWRHATAAYAVVIQAAAACPERLSGAAQHAVELAERCGNPTVRTSALALLAVALSYTSPETAFEVMREAMAVAATVGRQYLVEYYLGVGTMVGLVEATLSRPIPPEDALAGCLDVVARYRRSGLLSHAWSVMWTTVGLLSALGRDDDAARAFGCCEASGFPRRPTQPVPPNVERLDPAERDRLRTDGATTTLAELIQSLTGTSTPK